MGYFISIDGLDGSGKGTQSELLYERLQSEGRDVRLLSFPTYDDIASAAVKLYLSGELGKSASDTNAYAASVFFAVDRYISFKRDWEKDFMRDDCIIIANRYTTANAVHQLSKLPRELWDGFLSWLWDFEFSKLGLPAPDKVIYLKMPVAVSLSLIDSRADKTHVKKDIHEADAGFLENSYNAAIYAAERLGWSTVECCDEVTGELKSRKDIHDEIMKVLGELPKKA